MPFAPLVPLMPFIVSVALEIAYVDAGSCWRNAMLILYDVATERGA